MKQKKYLIVMVLTFLGYFGIRIWNNTEGKGYNALRIVSVALIFLGMAIIAINSFLSYIRQLQKDSKK